MIETLKVAGTPEDKKQSMLKVIETLREEVESGEILEIFALTLRPGSAFGTHSSGNISYMTLAGMLGRAQMDCYEKIDGEFSGL